MLTIEGAAAQWRPQFETHLKKLQSGSEDNIHYSVYSIAFTWAAAGHIRQANELLAQFRNGRVADPGGFQLYQDGLTVLWTLSGQRPDSISFAQRAVNEIGQDNWDDAFNPARWVWEVRQRIGNRSWKELSGLELYVKAILLCYDEHGVGHRSDEEQRKEAVQAFTRLSGSDSLGGYVLLHSMSCAAIAAASVGDSEKARAFIREWGKGYLKWPANTLTWLMRDTATAKMLLDGVLQPVWGLTAAECDVELGETLTVLKDRVQRGPSLVYGQLTLPQLLERLSPQGLKAPATETAILAAEKRLGVKLPEDYMAFLRASDGLDAADRVTPSFLPVEKIGSLKVMDKELVDIWGEALDDIDAEQAEGFRRSILIAGEHEEQQFLLVPPRGKQKEWQYWFFANWMPGIRPYQSLRFYLESVLLRREP